MSSPLLSESAGADRGETPSSPRSAWPLAMAFREWRCVGCRNVVSWQDAVVCEEDGKLYAIRHDGCVEPA